MLLIGLHACNILRVSLSMWQASIIKKTLSWVTGCGKWVFKGSAFRSHPSWVRILTLDPWPSIVMHTTLICRRCSSSNACFTKTVWLWCEGQIIRNWSFPITLKPNHHKHKNIGSHVSLIQSIPHVHISKRCVWGSYWTWLLMDMHPASEWHIRTWPHLPDAVFPACPTSFYWDQVWHQESSATVVKLKSRHLTTNPSIPIVDTGHTKNSYNINMYQHETWAVRSISLTRDARYWILADIRYADIFKLILADTDVYTIFLPDIFTL